MPGLHQRNSRENKIIDQGQGACFPAKLKAERVNKMGIFTGGECTLKHAECYQFNNNNKHHKSPALDDSLFHRN